MHLRIDSRETACASVTNEPTRTTTGAGAMTQFPPEYDQYNQHVYKTLQEEHLLVGFWR